MLDIDQLLRQVTGERRMLQAYIRAIVRDPHLIEDILQDVVVVAIRQREQFIDGTDLGAWLRAIARRTALAALRQAGRQGPLVAPETLDALDRNFALVEKDVWEEERDALRACLKELPDTSRQLLSCRYAENLSVEKIASACGRSLDSVKSTLKRLRAALGECVQQRLRRTLKGRP